MLLISGSLLLLTVVISLLACDEVKAGEIVYQVDNRSSETLYTSVVGECQGFIEKYDPRNWETEIAPGQIGEYKAYTGTHVPKGFCVYVSTSEGRLLLFEPWLASKTFVFEEPLDRSGSLLKVQPPRPAESTWGYTIVFGAWALIGGVVAILVMWKDKRQRQRRERHSARG